MSWLTWDDVAPTRSKNSATAGLLAHARARTSELPAVSSRHRVHTAAATARGAATEIAAGEPVEIAWRFYVLQSIDYYNSAYRRGGPSLAAEVFTEEPQLTGSSAIDASYAAVAEYLAHRDGWEPPAWVHDEHRTVTHWIADQPPMFHQRAFEESPAEFRARGIFTTLAGLSRA